MYATCPSFSSESRQATGFPCTVIGSTRRSSWNRGEVEIRLGDEKRIVTGRSVIFVPAGVQHGARNVGSEPADYVALFATSAIDIEYLERNPAPGTEDDPPQPPIVYDARVS